MSKLRIFKSAEHSANVLEGAERQRRAAYAQPRALVAMMVTVLMASTWWALAQRTDSGEPQTTQAAGGATSAGKRKPFSWADLPGMVHDYGQRRAAASLNTANTGTRRFALTEVDLTPGNVSDERDPSYRPNGDFIAFSSNGVDANADGRLDAGVTTANKRYHIWIMRRDGTGARQVTGVNASDPAANRDQRFPTWSPDGNRIVYVDGNLVNNTAAQTGINPAVTQLFVVAPFSSTVGTQITFVGGMKLWPAWNPTGTSIAFSSDVNVVDNTALGQFDIFTIDPSGGVSSVRRLTGGANDPLGNSTLDAHPAFSIVNSSVMFFSSNRENNARLAAGRRIFAMNAFTGANKRQVTSPTARGGSAADVDGNPTPSLTVSNFNSGGVLQNFPERLGFQSNSRIDASDTFQDFNIWSIQITTSAPVFLFGSGAVETAPGATLETNRVSSPNGLAATGLTGLAQDKSNDLEPNFSRGTTGIQQISQIAFSSQRTTAAAPSTVTTNPVPVVVNPGGGTNGTGTYDIWTTVVQDFVPPILVPIAVGSQLYPFVAPGRQSPFFAPRTAEDGLTPGTKLVVAAVLQEPESGLASVSITIKDADQPTFLPLLTRPNNNIQVEVAQEGQPVAVNGPLPLQFFDDGPTTRISKRTGRPGNERQANAIEGDGLYYCTGSFDTRNRQGQVLTGDFYIDLTTADIAGNGLNYDNVWGFSTRAFQKRSPAGTNANTNTLFVSDYTVGQTFPSVLASVGQNFNNFNNFNTFFGSEPRSFIGLPVETYLLTHPFGNLPGASSTPVPPGATPVPFPFPGVTYETFGNSNDNVDVWRVLARGEVPIEIINLYRPQVSEQLDPTDVPAFQRIRPVVVAQTAIVWASPYTGNVFAGPGTLYDGETQRRLTAYLNAGGRLFVTGKDVLFALSNAGTVTNTFIRDEMRAGFAGETGTDEISPTNSIVGLRGTLSLIFPNGSGIFFFGFQDNRPVNVPNVNVGGAFGAANTYLDAARNQHPNGSVDQFGMDIISPVAAGASETVTTLFNYTAGSGNGASTGVAGQRIERIRPSGLESRVVFFAFGLEGVNRFYSVGDNHSTSPHSHNHRRLIADSMRLQYFYTGAIRGQVINAATNLPIPNFLIEVYGAAPGPNTPRAFVVRTDQNGNYEIIGVPPGGYTVRPAQDITTGLSLNGAFFPGPQRAAGVTGGQTTSGVNFRVFPSPPGSISGVAVNDNRTPTNLTDDVIAAANLPVLLRSINPILPTSSFPSGGIFAAITVTDAFGRFSFSNVPSLVPMELVFNPRPGLMRNGGDIPNQSGIVYPDPDPQSSLRPNNSFGRRVIPIDPTYPVNFPTNPIIAPVGDSVNLGNIPVPPGTGPGAGPTPTPTPRATPVGTPGGPGTGPTPTPIPGGGVDEFPVGGTFMISIPYAESEISSAVTTPARAFTVPPVAPNGFVNYRLHRFSGTAQRYEGLANDSIIRRGEGYVLQTTGRGVSIRRPTDDPTRKPTNVPTFTIRLRLSPSLTSNNGYNLIGFPFNPAVYRSVNWLASTVTVEATGQTFDTLEKAVAAGVIARDLNTLVSGGSNQYGPPTTKMVPFKGYFARVFKDNVLVTLKASTSP